MAWDSSGIQEEAKFIAGGRWTLHEKSTQFSVGILRRREIRRNMTMQQRFECKGKK